MGSVATVYTDFVVREDQFIAACDNAEAAMQKLQYNASRISALMSNVGNAEWQSKSLDSQLNAWKAMLNVQGNANAITDDVIDGIRQEALAFEASEKMLTKNTNALVNNYNGTLKMQTAVVLLGSSLGVPTQGIHALNIALSTLGARGNILSSSTIPRLISSLKSIGATGWMVIAVIGSIVAAWKILEIQSEKEEEQIKKNDEALQRYIETRKKIKSINFGESHNKDWTEANRAYLDAQAELNKDIKDGVVKNPKEITSRQNEIDAMSKLAYQYMLLGDAQDEYNDKVFQAESTASVEYLKSNEYLRQKMDWNNELIKSIEKEQSALERNGSKWWESENKKRDLLKQNNDLQNTIAENNKKAAEEAAKPENERKESIDKLLTSLEDEAATTGKSAAEIVEYQLELLGATDAEIEYAMILADSTEEKKKAIEEDKKRTAELEKYQAQLEELKKQTKDLTGKLNNNETELKIIDIEELIKSGKITKEMGKEWIDNLKEQKRLQDLIDDKSKAKTIKDDILTPQEKYKNKVSEINRLETEHFLTAQQAAQAKLKAAEEEFGIKKQMMSMESAVEMYNRIQSSIGGANRNIANSNEKFSAMVIQANKTIEENTGKAAETSEQLLAVMKEFIRIFPQAVGLN